MWACHVGTDILGARIPPLIQCAERGAALVREETIGEIQLRWQKWQVVVAAVGASLAALGLYYSEKSR